MRKLIICLILVIINFIINISFSEAADFKKAILTFELKLNERLENKNNYLIINSFNHDPGLESQIISNTTLQMNYINEQEKAKIEFKKDFFDSINYALNLTFRDIPIIKKIRTALGGVNFQITKKTEKYQIDLPSPNRPLDPFEEKEEIINLENRYLNGEGPDISSKRIKLEKELERAKKLRAKESPFRIKFGLFTDIKTEQLENSLENSEEKRLVLEYGPQINMNFFTLENKIKYARNYEIFNKEVLIDENSIEVNSLKTLPSGLIVEIKNVRFLLNNQTATELNLSKRISSSLLLKFQNAQNWENHSNKNTISSEMVLSKKSSLNLSAEYNWKDNEYKTSSLFKIKF